MNNPIFCSVCKLLCANTTFSHYSFDGAISVEEIKERLSHAHRKIVSKLALFEPECSSHPAASPRLNHSHAVSLLFKKRDGVFSAAQGSLMTRYVEAHYRVWSFAAVAPGYHALHLCRAMGEII